MKYIRTKDGRIITLKDELIDNADLWVLGGKENILETADTIKELCDEFVLWKSDLGKLIPYTIPNDENNSYRLADIKHRFVCEKGFANVYGAIWTDKGLIYVAKMNDKGVLELL